MNRFSLSALSLVPALSLLALGCDEQLEPGTKIDSFRVLAQQADQPYAHPGETVQMTTLSHDPAGRPITWAWASCVNPQSSDLPGCLAKIAENPDPQTSVFALGVDQASPSLTIPADVIESLPSQARAGASVGLVSAACPGDLSLGAGPGGLPFVCKETDSGRELGLDEFSVGIKRLTVRENDRNQNPVVGGVTFDGTDWPETEVKQVPRTCNTDDWTYDTCADGTKHQIAIQLPDGTVESGQDELGNGFTEEVIVQYYATEGIFENEIKTSAETKNGWVVRKRAAGQLLTFWFVVRDNRGGVTWTTRQAQVL
jgi:hypothetical protein